MAAQVDVERLQELVREGYLTCRSHPTGKLVIWNYTPKTMYSGYWTAETMMCRGLITTPEGEIKARGFKKFFNYGDPMTGDIPNEPFKVTRKADGSLGIVYQIDGEPPAIATRGSFKSEQALHATQVLKEKYGNYQFDPQWTYLFEIVYPANRYVVNYDDMDDLILLAIIETETGFELDIHNPQYQKYDGYPFPVIEEYQNLKDLEEIQQIQEDGEEGFVIRFESGLRIKIKFDEYKRLFKILTQTSNRTVWEQVKEQRPLSEILDNVPPEFEAWVRVQSRMFAEQYTQLHTQTELIYKQVVNTTSIELPFEIGSTLSASQHQSLDRLMKKTIRERFHAYPEIEKFLLMKWDGINRYYYPDGRVITDRKAVLRLQMWDSFYPEHERPYMVDGEEKFIEKEEGVAI